MPFLDIHIFDNLPLRLDGRVNPYVLDIIQAQEKETLPLLFGKQLQAKKGLWKSLLSQKTELSIDKLILEVGIHKGQVFKKLSMDNPQHGFMGMDITMKRVVLSARSLQSSGIRNALVVLGNAKFILDIFEEKELDGIIIFFPDPWTKKIKQVHKRLIHLEFCKDLSQVLKPGGFFWFKTDSLSYFEDVSRYMASLNFSQSHDRPLGKEYESNFQSRFKEKNQETYEICFLKQ